MREAATICPAPCKLTVDLLTLKVVSASRVMWATSLPILVFLGLSDVDLGPMYATDRHTSDSKTDVRHASSLNAAALWGRGNNKLPELLITSSAFVNVCVATESLLLFLSRTRKSLPLRMLGT